MDALGYSSSSLPTLSPNCFNPGFSIVCRNPCLNKPSEAPSDTLPRSDVSSDARTRTRTPNRCDRSQILTKDGTRNRDCRSAIVEPKFSPSARALRCNRISASRYGSDPQQSEKNSDKGSRLRTPSKPGSRLGCQWIEEQPGKFVLSEDGSLRAYIELGSQSLAGYDRQPTVTDWDNGRTWILLPTAAAIGFERHRLGA